MVKDKNKIENIVKTISGFLKEKGMSDFLEEVGIRLQKLGRSESEKVLVFTSVNLNEDDHEKAKRLIKNNFVKNVSDVEFRVDERLIDGMVVFYKDKKWDLSLRGKLEKARKFLS